MPFRESNEAYDNGIDDAIIASRCKRRYGKPLLCAGWGEANDEQDGERHALLAHDAGRSRARAAVYAQLGAAMVSRLALARGACRRARALARARRGGRRRDARPRCIRCRCLCHERDSGDTS